MSTNNSYPKVAAKWPYPHSPKNAPHPLQKTPDPGAAAGDAYHQFRTAEKRAFTIMPFNKAFDGVWAGSIKPACLECGYAPLRVDEVNLSSVITEDIEKCILSADLILVDLTDNNPNVMFECGWALAHGKPIIAICQVGHSKNLAFDVKGIRHIKYENSWQGVEDLKGKLKPFIASTEHHAGYSKAVKKPKHG